MGQFGDYESGGQVFFEGKLLAEATGVDVDGQNQGSDVNTMHGGFVGTTKGPFKSTLTVRNAVPKGGLEAEFTRKCVEQARVRVVVVRGGERQGYEGKIDSVSSTNESDAAAELTFTVLAGKPKIIS